MRTLTAGIVAHVDAGKTTLSEALLHLTGRIRDPGRVDLGTAFLDTDVQEKERGITIFSKQAVLEYEDRRLILLDTPGHVDFSAEAERVFSVLDFAILVISATDGVQSHTRTLWRLLSHYQIPVFVFINKTDISQCRISDIVAELHSLLSENCVLLSEKEWMETAALSTETALEEYSENGVLSEKTVRALIKDRLLFPVFSGSALKESGVEEFLQGVFKYAPETEQQAEFGARVFKISTDEKGRRLTHLKVTGGVMLPKMLLSDEKVEEIRLYSGKDYESLKEAAAGLVVCVTGPKKTFPGQGLGFETDRSEAVLVPVLSYSLLLPSEVSPFSAYQKLFDLTEEMPELGIVWDEEKKEIRIRSMGLVQNEILQRMVKDRLGFVINFGPGKITYRETIREKVTGFGHFEPLRHYAEVHLRLEPAERGSGLSFDTECSTDVLALNWQRLILTHLKEKTHRGVLTGSPITDLKITVTGGRAHLKHTEGGDFRQATYRAVRQGLKKAKSVLLEPWYAFTLMLPATDVGRVMTDLSERGCRFDQPEQDGDTAVIRGKGPVSSLAEYPAEIRKLTGGHGAAELSFDGYEECRDAEAVIEKIGYSSEEDLKNPTGSVFCAHGAGFTVAWDEVENYIQAEVSEEDGIKTPPPVYVPKAAKAVEYHGTYEEDLELDAIFEKQFGPVKRRLSEDYYEKMPKVHTEATGKTTEDYRKKNEKKKSAALPEVLLVDGYNVIHAWKDLKELAEADLGAARDALTDRLCNYQGFTGAKVILVFDAYKRRDNPGSVIKYNNIWQVYTKEGETADMYIEKTTRTLSKDHRVRVATSDALEQTLAFGGGAERISAREFEEEVKRICTM